MKHSGGRFRSAPAVFHISIILNPDYVKCFLDGGYSAMRLTSHVVSLLRDIPEMMPTPVGVIKALL